MSRRSSQGLFSFSLSLDGFEKLIENLTDRIAAQDEKIAKLQSFQRMVMGSAVDEASVADIGVADPGAPVDSAIKIPMSMNFGTDTDISRGTGGGGAHGSVVPASSTSSSEEAATFNGLSSRDIEQDAAISSLKIKAERMQMELENRVSKSELRANKKWVEDIMNETVAKLGDRVQELESHVREKLLGEMERTASWRETSVEQLHGKIGIVEARLVSVAAAAASRSGGVAEKCRTAVNEVREEMQTQSDFLDSEMQSMKNDVEELEDKVEELGAAHEAALKVTQLEAELVVRCMVGHGGGDHRIPIAQSKIDRKVLISGSITKGGAQTILVCEVFKALLLGVCACTDNPSL